MKSLYDALNYFFQPKSPLSFALGDAKLVLMCMEELWAKSEDAVSRKFPLDKVLGGKFTSLTVVCLFVKM